MEPFLISTGIVAVAEIGDKTQLLAFLLATRFRKPLPIILGIFIATVANHGLAGGLGVWAASQVSMDTLRWVLGLSFLVMAAWVLLPDKIDEDPVRLASLGIFGTTLIAFFIAEMGDKTQVATAMLVANYNAFFAVILGTTMGMMLANVPVVCLGEGVANRIPVAIVRKVAAAVFLLLGLLTLLGSG